MNFFLTVFLILSLSAQSLAGRDEQMGDCLKKSKCSRMIALGKVESYL